MADSWSEHEPEETNEIITIDSVTQIRRERANKIRKPEDIAR